jgi:hypothetical protein
MKQSAMGWDFGSLSCGNAWRGPFLFPGSRYIVSIRPIDELIEMAADVKGSRYGQKKYQ